MKHGAEIVFFLPPSLCLLQRYMLYFSLTREQLDVVLKEFQAEVQRGLELHKQNPKEMWEPMKCSLLMIDSFITEPLIPKGTEKGVSVFIQIIERIIKFEKSLYVLQDKLAFQFSRSLFVFLSTLNFCTTKVDIMVKGSFYSILFCQGEKIDPIKAFLLLFRL